jgi:hypothetical protein
MQRQYCLDMMKVSWVGTDGFRKSDCAIILEIDPAGGLVQTIVAIPCSSEITLDTGLGLVPGHVTSCEEDAYGYIVNFAIKDQAGTGFRNTFRLFCTQPAAANAHAVLPITGMC